MSITIELVDGPSDGRCLTIVPGLTRPPRVDHEGWRFTYGPAGRLTASGREAYKVVGRMPLGTTHPAWLRRRP